ncbi:MAG: hypothetical protein U0996_25630 [Planctomycetaceae bacterium]
MQTIHTVLAVPQPYREALAESLALNFAVQFVPSPSELEAKEWIIANAVKSLLEKDLSVDDLIVLVTDIPESSGVPAFCERLLIEFPELTIMGIGNNGSAIRCFQLQIQVQEMSSSLSELSAAIQACADRALPW